MKRLFCLFLTVIMTLSLSLVAFASEDDGNSFTDDSLTQNVGADYTAGSEMIDAGTVYSVSIEWTNIGTLKYQGANGGTYRWNPNTLKYELSGNTAASWTDASVEIDITNKSNTGIMVQATYADKTGDSAQTSMRDWTDNTTLVSVGSAAVDAEGEEIDYTNVTTTGTEQTAHITGTVTATGSISEDTTSVGTITLTLQERGDEPIWQYDSTGALSGVVLGASTDLVIPEGVTAIAENAFKDQTEITSIMIPASVENIGAGAFANCTGLNTIGWELNTDAQIGAGAFDGYTDKPDIYIWVSTCSGSCGGSNGRCVIAESYFNEIENSDNDTDIMNYTCVTLHFIHEEEFPGVNS